MRQTWRPLPLYLVLLAFGCGSHGSATPTVIVTNIAPQGEAPSHDAEMSPSESDRRARRCSFRRQWSAVQLEGLADFGLDWDSLGSNAPFSVRSDRSAVVIRTTFLMSLDADPRVPASRPSDATWLLHWRRGEPNKEQP